MGHVCRGKKSIGCHIDGCLTMLGSMIKEAMIDYADLHAECSKDHEEWMVLKSKKRNRLEDIRFRSLDTENMIAYDSAKWFIFADREIDAEYMKKVGTDCFRLPTIQNETLKRLNTPEVVNA